MKNILHFIVFSLVLLVTSCYPEGAPDEKTEQTDAGELREKTGGSPSEVTTQGSGVFFDPNQGCKSGFGWCNVDLYQPGEGSESTVPSRPELQRFEATFYLSTAASEPVLRVEFNEDIPHFAATFNVPIADTLTRAFGLEYLIVQQGSYKAVKQPRPGFGYVEIPVIKGPARPTTTQ